MPEGVAKHIDKIQSGFLWGDDEVKRKLHLVNWERMCWRKDRGGLGFRKIRVMNLLLLIMSFSLFLENLSYTSCVGILACDTEFL